MSLVNKPSPASADGKSASVPSMRRWFPLALFVALLALVLHQEWHHHLSLERLATDEMALRAAVAERPLLATLVYAAIYVAIVALSVPGAAALTLAGGFLFGWLTAGLVTVVAATLGATAVFLVARSTLGAFLAARAGPRLAALADGFRRDAFSYLLFLRLVPAFPFWLVNLAPALLDVRLSTYVIATFAGIVPGTFAFAVIGSGLGGVLAAQRQGYEACLMEAAAPEACSLTLDPSAVLTPGLLTAFVALGVLALVPVVGRRLMRRRGMAPNE